MKRYTTTDGIKTLIYEDETCKVICSVADFRDPTWWIDVLEIVDKKNNESILPFKFDKELEIYQRIVLDLGNRHNINEIVTSKFGFIKYDEVKPLAKQFENPVLD